MQKIFKWLAVILLVAVSGAGIVYLTIIRPIAQEEAHLKPILPPLANYFMDCLEKYKIDACYAGSTTDKFKRAVSLPQLAMIAGKMKTNLGDRIAARLIDKTFNLFVFKSTTGSVKSVRFQMQAMYKLDPSVIESFVFALDSTSKEYRLESLNINSDRMLH